MHAEFFFVVKIQAGFFAQNSVKSNVWNDSFKKERLETVPSMGIVSAFFVTAEHTAQLGRLPRRSPAAARRASGADTTGSLAVYPLEAVT